MTGEESDMKQRRQTSETFMVASLLAVIGGFCDTYSYLCRGEVFANAQTGNIVLLAVNIAKFEWRHAAYYLLPITAFIAGIFISELLRSIFKEREGALHWRQVILIAEMMIIAGVGFIPAGAFDFVANILISFFCAIQLETFRKVQGNVFASTMCTGNLRSGSAFLYRYVTGKEPDAMEKSRKYFAIDFIFILGAMLGTICSKYFGVKGIWLLEVPLIAAFILMFIEEMEEKSKRV